MIMCIWNIKLQKQNCMAFSLLLTKCHVYWLLCHFLNTWLFKCPAAIEGNSTCFNYQAWKICISAKTIVVTYTTQCNCKQCSPTEISHSYIL